MGPRDDIEVIAENYSEENFLTNQDENVIHSNERGSPYTMANQQREIYPNQPNMQQLSTNAPRNENKGSKKVGTHSAGSMEQITGFEIKHNSLPAIGNVNAGGQINH